MKQNYTEENYLEMIQRLFLRFPSFQKVGSGAYKPGMDSMLFADQLMGHPHRKYRIIHVAGTNGKGSVSNMLASALASEGLKVGLYTSPHILDFRERIRVVEDSGFRLIPQEDVWDFVQRWNDTFDHLDMSFFEITTMMALDWFAAQETDVVVLETGLGGRLDSTNIVTPVLSVITNIGLDHCDMLGDTLAEIAFEKSGIIKPKVPIVVGESHPETDPVFERKVLYTNLPEPEFMGSRTAVMSLLTFADKTVPPMWGSHADILQKMDLKGSYQEKNLRTVLAALGVMKLQVTERTAEALVHTSARTGFHGRWEQVCDDPLVICDIGHNEHGLRYNFSQLSAMKNNGDCTDLIVVYGSVADKDVDAVLHLLPEDARYIFTRAQGKRALDAEVIRERYLAFCRESGRPAGDICVAGAVIEAVKLAMEAAAGIKTDRPDALPLIYVGGSTYVVSEAVAYLNELKAV